MRTNYLLYFLFLGLLVQTSCKSTKDIMMFQDQIMENSSLHFNQSTPFPEELKIKPFDNLYIRIWTLDDEVNKLFNPSLSENGITNANQQFGSGAGQYLNGYRVGTDGTVSLPVLGEINLVGLNLKEAEVIISEKAIEYLKEPIVQVKLLNFRIDILGEVAAPGIYYNYEQNMNIIDAIAMSGGITNYANLRNVIVNRQSGNRTNSYKIDITNNELYNSDVYYLQPNDIVYIPPSKLIRRGENVGNYSLILSTLTSLLVIVSFFGINP